MTAEEMYENNTDFREYVDRFVRKNPEYTVEDALKHKIIKEEITKMYSGGYI